MMLGAPLMLLALLALPLIILLSRLRAREQRIVVSSTLIWQRVLAANLAAPKERKLKLDALLALMLAALALAIFGAAKLGWPEDAGGGRAPKLLLDRSSAILLAKADGAPLVDQALLERAGLDSARMLPGVRANLMPEQRSFDRDYVLALARESIGQHVLVISPREMGDWPASITQVSYAPDLASSPPLTTLDVSGTQLFARLNSSQSGWWRLVTLSGTEIARAQPQQGELILPLARQSALDSADASNPPAGNAEAENADQEETPSASSRQPLKLEDPQGVARAFVLPIQAVTLKGSEVSARQLKALDQALGERTTLCERERGEVDASEAASPSAPMDAVSAKLALPTFHLNAQGANLAARASSLEIEWRELVPSLMREITTQDLEGASVIVAADGIAAQLLEDQRPALESLRFALPDGAYRRVHLALRTADGRELPLLAELMDGRTVVSALGCLGEQAESAWVPLILAAGYEAMSGYSLLDGPRYTTSQLPRSRNDLPLKGAEIETLLPATPAPGLYASGVINLLVPDASELITQDRLEFPDLRVGTAAPRWLEFPLWLTALICLACASALWVFRLESGLRSAKA